MAGKDIKKSGRTYTGIVVSDKMEKTVVVKVTRTFMHSRIHKVVRLDKKYKVHDENSVANIGDVVEFCEVRPISKMKSMSLTKVVRLGSNGK